MYRYGHLGLHDGPGLFGWFFMALFVLAVVLLGVALVRAWRGFGSPGRFLAPPHPGPGIDPALNELRIRYARGEISWEEYAQRATNLGFPTAPAHPTPPPMAGTPMPPAPPPQSPPA